MNKVIRSVVISLVVTLLASCATADKYRKRLYAWHGKDIQKFVDIWGYPDKKIQAPDGNWVYVYREHNVTRMPIFTNPGYTTISQKGGHTVVTSVPSSTSGGGVFSNDCTTWVEVNHDNLIVNTTFKGNDCTSY